MSHVISARIDDKIYSELADIAKKRKRKVAEILLEAVGFYVNHCAEYSIALDRLNNPLDEVISERELLDDLGW